MKGLITVSIVLYNNEVEEILSLVNSLIKTELNIRVYLIDNSATDILRKSLASVSNKVEYIHPGANLGYGKANNIAIQQAISNKAVYHLVLNPDIIINEGVLENISNYLNNHQDIGVLMPKVVYEDGTIQRLCKLLPGPWDLIGRRFFKGGKNSRRNAIYELSFFDYASTLNVSSISGCFMFFRTSVLEKIGGFDDRFFMYLEDYDLSRRASKVSRAVFYPEVHVIHKYRKESYVNKKLLWIHIQSAIKYFNKWGWFLDADRTKMNREVLQDLKNKGYQI